MENIQSSRWQETCIGYNCNRGDLRQGNNKARNVMLALPALLTRDYLKLLQ